MLFYDFEVFKYDWLVVIYDITRERLIRHVIINSIGELREVYDQNVKNIWVGYNSRSYDQYILKGILAGHDPKKINDYIIVEKQKGAFYSKAMKTFPLNNFDVMPNPPVGLKTLEGFLGSNIKETDVPFDIDRRLTQEEIDQTVQYCVHDVEQTIEVFLQRKNVFLAQLRMCEAFDLPLSYLSETEARITAKVLDCSKRKWDDEFDYFFLPCIKLNKYKHVLNWFKNAVHESLEEMKAGFEEAKYNMVNAVNKRQEMKWLKRMKQCNYNDPICVKEYFYDRSLQVNVAGVPHTFGWGGLHGAPDKPALYSGLILHVDVGSYYPSMLIAWDMVTRSAKSGYKYKDTYDTRMALKAAGKKKEQEPYKKLLNSLSGAMKDQTSPAFDPRNNNAMCVNGQLMLLDLIEKLEVIPGFELIQSNTDGLIIKIPDTDEAFNMADDICYEWEMRCSTDKCKILLSLDQIAKIYQKDVNNYLWVDCDGKVERKGAYVKELSAIDNDLPIINKALVEYMVHGTPVEHTINSCDELIQFQKLVKLSDKYKHVEWNGTKYTYKCYRVFASSKPTGKIYKCGGSRGKPEKFANTPDDCFIFNDAVHGVNCPKYLNKQWYIDLAKKRLGDYGIWIA